MCRGTLLMFIIILLSFSLASGEKVRTDKLEPITGPALKIYPEGVVPDKAGPDAVCESDWQGNPASYIPDWYMGNEFYAVYQDPEELGCENAYPFQLYAVIWEVQTMDNGPVEFPVQPIIYTADLSDPLCPKPGVVIYRGQVQGLYFNWPGTWSVELYINCCVEGPYFVGIHCPEYIGVGQLGLVVDNGATEPFLARSCAIYNNWMGWWSDLIDDEGFSNNIRLWSVGFNADEADCDTCMKDIQFGYDLWFNDRDGILNYPMEDAWVYQPIPADFFGPGSDPFEDHVYLESVPLPPELGNADAVIERKQTAVLPAISSMDTIDIELAAMSLIGTSPIIVTYNGGFSPELWNVEVCLSEGPQGPGRMILSRSCCYGGSFWGDLLYYPKFIFTHPQQGERVFDFPLMGRLPIFYSFNGTWSSQIHPPYYFDMPWAEFFYSPGMVAYDHDCNPGTVNRIIGQSSQFVFCNESWGPCYIEDPCCCELQRGNVDCSELDEPDVSDIVRLIDFLYLSHDPLCCVDEADVDASGGESDISDIVRLIDYLYLSHDPLALCQ